jgi:hypothetical protein
LKLLEKLNKVAPDIIIKIEKLKMDWNNRPLKGNNGLVTYVYKKYHNKYPNLFDKSEIKKEILGESEK